MGEVIKVDFKRKKIVGEEEKHSKLETEKKREAKSQEEKMSNYRARFIKFLASDKAEGIVNLKVPFNLSSEFPMEGYSVKTLVEWLEESEGYREIEDKTFFQAIIKELIRRFNLDDSHA